MNERVRELFEQQVYPNFSGTGAYKLRRNLKGQYLNDTLEDHWQTFQEGVELAVKECYDLCKDNLIKTDIKHDLTYNDGVMDCAVMLKQHFGIE